jgi:hypothetical protein
MEKAAVNRPVSDLRIGPESDPGGSRRRRPRQGEHMVKPTLEEIRASDLTPLERELALASFGAEALADAPAALAVSAA